MHSVFTSQELSDEALREDMIRKHFTSRIAELNTKVNLYTCTIMHLYMKGTAQGISAIYPSGSFELSIYPRVYGCQATNASPLALVITNSVCNCIMVQVTCTMGF